MHEDYSGGSNPRNCYHSGIGPEKWPKLFGQNYSPCRISIRKSEFDFT